MIYIHIYIQGRPLQITGPKRLTQIVRKVLKINTSNQKILKEVYKIFNLKKIKSLGWFVTELLQFENIPNF